MLLLRLRGRAPIPVRSVILFIIFAGVLCASVRVCVFVRACDTYTHYYEVWPVGSALIGRKVSINTHSHMCWHNVNICLVVVR